MIKGYLPIERIKSVEVLGILAGDYANTGFIYENADPKVPQSGVRNVNFWAGPELEQSLMLSL